MFAHNHYITETVSALIRRERCRDFVETGTLDGDTALGMHLLFPDLTVWTVEIDEARYACNHNRFAGTGIRDILGDSSIELAKQILPHLRPRPFIFLDAHTPTYPLLAELDAIAQYRHLRPIIAIHDFVVPGHPEMEYDEYCGPLDWAMIRDHVGRIYDPPVPHFYPTQVAGEGNRGIIYIGAKRA